MVLSLSAFISLAFLFLARPTFVKWSTFHWAIASSPIFPTDIHHLQQPHWICFYFKILHACAKILNPFSQGQMLLFMKTINLPFCNILSKFLLGTHVSCFLAINQSSPLNGMIFKGKDNVFLPYLWQVVKIIWIHGLINKLLKICNFYINIYKQINISWPTVRVSSVLYFLSTHLI